MPNTKRSSSQSIREPFGEVTELLQVPVALFEIQALARESGNDRIVSLVTSIISTTLADLESWQKLQEVKPSQ